jgi:putative component of toxin-antitoxin plasmid stabilization module
MATVRKTPEFDKALRNIRDAQAKQKILIRIDRLELGNPGDHRN